MFSSGILVAAGFKVAVGFGVTVGIGVVTEVFPAVAVGLGVNVVAVF
jgi:hypothetical protein